MSREARLNAALRAEIESAGFDDVKVSIGDPYNATAFEVTREVFEMIYAYRSGDVTPLVFGDGSGAKKFSN
jgi:hypothetical protein